MQEHCNNRMGLRMNVVLREAFLNATTPRINSILLFGFSPANVLFGKQSNFVLAKSPIQTMETNIFNSAASRFRNQLLRFISAVGSFDCCKMGRGGKEVSKATRHNAPAEVNKPQESLSGQPKPQSVEPPPFTEADVRKYIRERSNGVDLFKPNLFYSSLYLVRDLVFAAVILYLGLQIHTLPAWMQFIAWPSYW